MFPILLVVFLSVIAVYFCYRFKECSIVSLAPGTRPQLYFGNLLQSGILTGTPYFEIWSEFQRKYGDIYEFWYGTRRVFVFNRFEHAQHIFGNRQIYELSDLISETVSLLIPTGLIALKGKEYKRHAHHVLPMMKKLKHQEKILGTVVKYTDELIDEWRRNEEQYLHTDIVKQCKELMLNIISFITINVEISKNKNVETKFALKQFIEHFQTARIIMFCGFPAAVNRLWLKLYWPYQRALKLLRANVNKIIKEEQEKYPHDTETMTTTKSKNLVSCLVSSLNVHGENTQGLSKDELFDEILISVFAVFETTSTILSWFIYYASTHPDIQQKIKDELKNNQITSDVCLTTDLLDQLIYLDCVVKEVLRHSPTIDMVLRSAQQTDQIDGIQLNKGDTIMVGIYNIHHDRRLWTVDPDQFIPERFLEGDKHRTVMTFGGGHRACAGQDFARTELKTVIVRLMQVLTFVDGGQSGGYIQDITCTPKRLAVYVHFDRDNDKIQATG